MDSLFAVASRRACGLPHRDRRASESRTCRPTHNARGACSTKRYEADGELRRARFRRTHHEVHVRVCVASTHRLQVPASQRPSFGDGKGLASSFFVGFSASVRWEKLDFLNEKVCHVRAGHFRGSGASRGGRLASKKKGARGAIGAGDRRPVRHEHLRSSRLCWSPGLRKKRSNYAI